MVDRVTTLITIVFLTGFKHVGIVQIGVFLLCKSLVLFNFIEKS